MTISDLLQSSYQSLTRTKARSSLTMLGIVIGIASVILMLSIGEGAQRYILGQISSFGSDILFVTNGPKVEEGQPTLFIKESLTLRDARRLEQETWMKNVVARIALSDELTANGFDTTVQIAGTSPDEAVLYGLHTQEGEFFGRASVESRERVVVLGHEVANKAFGETDPLGKTVKIGTANFRVIGVMEAMGTKAFQNVDKQVYIPVTAVADVYNKKYLSYIMVRTALPLDRAKERLQVALRDYHNLDNPNADLAKDDFNVTTQEDAVKNASTITSILQTLLVAIASISLIVGGIGIMNIMYVSVTERIKEIGLRKAIGARRRDILGQFLTEAVVLTGLGGILGVTFGFFLSWLAITLISTVQDGWTFELSVRGAMLGFVVSTAIGIVFGYFPAKRAAALNPIDALRVE